MYVDETGLDKYFIRQYGRALRGEKVYGEVRGRKFERVSIVAGQNGREILSPLQFTGVMNAMLFEEWFAKHLLPASPEGAVIIMDNASFHRKKQLNILASETGRQVMFLPPYSPELNPIEHFWHWLKKTVTDTLRLTSDLASAISTAFKML